ncbi:MAG: putative colanic acid biosynthesis acetyltransferase [Rhizobiaceae bacterium]
MDVQSNRAARKWTRRENAGRVLWALAHPLFAWSPRPFWGWRRALLRLFKAKIGNDVHVYPTVRITIPWNLSIADGSAVGDRVILYALGPIALGRATTVSQNSHLCAGSHDYRRADRPLTKPPITIGDRVWICADAFVGPNVNIGDGAIVGARAVVIKDVTAQTIVAGNPAVEINHLD